MEVSVIIHFKEKAMDTKIFDLRDKTIYNDAMKAAACSIKNGGIVVFPTETVYGLGADAFNYEGVQKIFEAKGRPGDNPLIVHIADREDIFLVCDNVSEDALKLANAFMPGPISIVMHQKGCVAQNVTAGLSTVAVRCPAKKEARDFIKTCGVPIAAPSANISGKPSPTKARHVIKDMNGKADVILLADDSEVGLESTVVDMSSDVCCILRPGAVSADMLRKVLGKEVWEAYKEKLVGAPKAPGMKYKHYKPDSYIITVHGSVGNAEEYINKRISEINVEPSKIACIVFNEASNINCSNVYYLGSANSPEQAAASLFASLRLCDENGISMAFVMSTNYGGIGDAYINRLHKASDEIITLEN